jgi:predicted SPOUT superfamily RNA methylase MTH1
VDNAQSKELRTYLIGEIARTLGIFKISEVIIFHDKLKDNSKDYINYFIKKFTILRNPTIFT